MLVPLGAGRREPERRRPLLRSALGAVMRRMRKEQGRTLAAVARAARVSVPYLSELERGRKEASSEVLAAICDALGIGLADLLAEARHDLAAQGSAPGTVIRLASANPGVAPRDSAAQLALPPDTPVPGSAPQACLRAA
jgi:transcriptional regulator with XRE-family HTH domain